MKTLVISGISGFIGRHLKSKFRYNYNIVGLSRLSSESNNTYDYGHLNSELLNRSEAFIHLAGKAHDLKKDAVKDDYFGANTELTKVLFDKWLNSESKIFIFMSSVKAVADHIDTVLTEEDYPNPKTFYGKSKLAAERYLVSKTIPQGKFVYILRPCMIHGPNNKGNLNLLFNIVKTGLPYPLGAFQNKRSLLSIDNLNQIIEKLIEIRPKSGIYNLADDEAVSTYNIVKIMGEVINKKVWTINVPVVLVKAGAKVGDFIPLPINSERLEKLTENYIVSNKKIIDNLNIELKYSSKEGLKKTIESFKN